VADNVSHAEEAEALCVELEKRIKYRGEQLVKLKWDMSTVEQNDNKSREDLQEKVIF